MSQFPEVIAALLDPAQYTDESLEEIKLLQTQMSFVLLTGKYAYKIRKPVNLGYVDYSTLEKRKLFSEKEIALNRRLCPEVYIGIVPVVRRKGKVALGGDGEIIDYAVKMKRLPDAGMMDRLLENDGLTAEMVAAVARKMAEFHAGAKTGEEINQFGSLSTIKHNVAENFEQSRTYIERALSQRQFDRLKAYFDDFINTHTTVFERRIADGRIRDCHGDLHSAHINFLGDNICIYDCIEFNDRFRYGDTASEISFLAMDLDRHGRADLRRAFVSEYIRTSDDSNLCELLHFYQAYRAHIRAKVACFKLDDPFVPESEKAIELEKAKGYFNLALAYSLPRPQLFITVGFTGCGKSTLAAELSRHLGLHHISSDITRKTLAGLPLTRCAGTEIGKGIYSSDMNGETYTAMMDQAEETLVQGDSVILDATFLLPENRGKAIEMAKRRNAEIMIIECRLDEARIKERLNHRKTKPGVSDGCWEIYLSQEPRFEPVMELPIGRNHVIIDMHKPVNDNLRQIVDLLL